MQDIKDYENLYAITEDGKIWSYKSNKFIKPFLCNGYARVNLHKNGKSQKFFIHRLVAETYINNPNNYPEVNHKNENRLDNTVKNLEWCTHKYNINYGTRTFRASESHKGHHHTEESKKKISETKKKMSAELKKKIGQSHNKSVLCLETGIIFKSITEAHKQTGINLANISECCNGNRKTAGKYHWQFF